MIRSTTNKKMQDRRSTARIIDIETVTPLWVPVAELLTFGLLWLEAMRRWLIWELMAQLKRDIESIKDNQGCPVKVDSGWPSLAVASSSLSSTLTSTVPCDTNLTLQLFVGLKMHKTVKDISRRKCNVVIGSHECSETNSSREVDSKAFHQLCEVYLSIKPALAAQGCHRLGHSTGQHGCPRSLLVHLRTESCTAECWSSLICQAPATQWCSPCLH